MGYTILIVDDNKFPRLLLKRALKEFSDFEINEATNGMEALEKIRDINPDLIFLDLTMPEMDGYELLELLQKKGLSLKIVVVSADVQPKAIKRVTDLGACSFLEKPVKEEEVKDVLRKLGMI